MNTPKRKVYYPAPDASLIELLNKLLREAANKMLSGKDLRFPSPQRTTRGSIEVIRAKLGNFQEHWSDWSLGKWPEDEPLAHPEYTNALLEFLKGSFGHKKFEPEAFKQNAKDVHAFLVSKPDRAETVKQARKLLESYKATILGKEPSWTPPLELSADAVLAEDGLDVDGDSKNDVVIPPGTPTRIDPRIYSGAQREAFHPETRRIVATLAELEREKSHLIPTGLPALEYQVGRDPGASEGVDEQKRLLYGGLSDISLGFTVHDYVAAKFSFQRSVSEQIASLVINAAEDFTSHTIIARPGQGKSLALAQILARLTSTSGLWTFWSIQISMSDRAKSAPFRCDEDVRAIENYFRLLERCECFPKRLIFLFDDFSNRPRSDAPAITRFHRWCQEYSEQEGRPISLVFSANDRRHTLSSGNDTMDLIIDEADEQRLFTVLTETKPIVVRKRSSLDEMLVVHFEEKRHIKDDVQSFSDFIIRHSDRVDDFTPNWITDLESESSISLKVLPAIAASQLLDLALPEHIAHRIAELGTASPKSLADVSRRISRQRRAGNDPADDRWDGYVLISPYHARSLLDGLKKLNENFLKEMFFEIVGHSLSRAKIDLKRWNLTDEGYVRHLFHRLARKVFNRLDRLADGPSIADELFATYGETIAGNLRTQFDPDLCARWAGTFSTLNLFGRFGIDRESPERYVFELCRDVVFSREKSVLSPQAFVLSMESMEALCKSFRHEKSVIELARNAEGAINLDAVLLAALDGSDSQWERRANEVLHSYVKFSLAVPNQNRWEACRRVLEVYEGAERIFATKRAQLDAANYLELANCVWMRKNNKDDVELRAHYLRLARHSVLSQFRQQGMWNRRVQNQIRAFERDYRHGVEAMNMADAKVEDGIE